MGTKLSWVVCKKPSCNSEKVGTPKTRKPANRNQKAVAKLAIEEKDDEDVIILNNSNSDSILISDNDDEPIRPIELEVLGDKFIQKTTQEFINEHPLDFIYSYTAAILNQPEMEHIRKEIYNLKETPFLEADQPEII